MAAWRYTAVFLPRNPIAGLGLGCLVGLILGPILLVLFVLGFMWWQLGQCGTTYHC